MISDEHLLIWLRKKLDNFRQYRKTNYDNKFIENQRLYESYRDHKLQLWQTNVFLSYAFSMIQTILPREVGYIWQGDKLVKAHPRDEEDEVDADIVDSVMQWQTDTQIPNLFMEWVEVLQTHLMQGNGIGKLTWNIEKDRPEFISLDVLDFYPQPFKKYVDEMDCFHVFDMPVDILLKKQKIPGAGYQNIEKLVHTSMMTAEEESNVARDAEVGRMKVFEPSRPTALIYQYWGKVPVQDSVYVGIPQLSFTDYQEGLIEVGNRNYITRNLVDEQKVPRNPYATDENPEGFKPFISAKNYLVPGEFWGKGDIEPIKDLQYESNEMFNNIMDNVKIGMNRMWLVSKDAGINLSNLTSYPGNVVQGNNINPDGIRSLEHRDIPQSAFQMLETLPPNMQNMIGVHDYTKGANMPGMTDTVGGITSLIEEANMRFAFKIRVVQYTAIKDFATKLFMLNKIFMKGTQIPVRLEGAKGERWAYIYPDNLKGMYDFKPVAIAMIGNKLARENTQIRLLEVLSKAPPIPPLIEAILEEHEFKNKDEIMSYMYKMWGIPPPGAVPPQGVAPGGGAGVPFRQPPPPGVSPEATSSPQANAQLSQLIAGGMR